MFQHLTLHKPLAVIDLETTGVNPNRDRIVEISVLKILPDGRHRQRTWRVNPGISIPVSASAIHGISDEDVADEATFEDLADTLITWIGNADLCGYNLKKFDLRVLYCEFNRVGATFDMEGRAIIDPMEIFYRYEPRDLAAAVRRYLGREHASAHSAAADVLATAQILDAMLARHEDLPRSVDGLHEEFLDPDRVDSDGFFRRVEGEIRFVKGKHRGQPLAAIAGSSPDYLRWMLAQDLFDDTKAIVRDALTHSSRGN